MLDEAATNYKSIPTHEGSKGGDGDGSKMNTSSTPSAKKNLFKFGAGVCAFGLIGSGIIMMKSSTFTLLQTTAVVKTDSVRHCCNAGDFVDRNKPGNDEDRCDINDCKATPDYAAYHTDDPCVLHHAYCCPKSNYERHTAWLFGGCVEN